MREKIIVLIFLLILSFTKLLLANEPSNFTEINNDATRNIDLEKNKSENDTIPPEIIITSHQDKNIEIIQENQPTAVTGRIKDSSEIAALIINQKKVAVDKEGVFRMMINLKPGDNQISINAMDIYGNKAQVIFTIIGKNQEVIIQQEKNLTDAIKDDLTGSGNYYALIIGNNNYKNFPKLETAVNDAKEVEKILNKKFGFKTKILLDATRSDILHSFNDYVKSMKENDNFLLYYAGHGYFDKIANKAYWIPVDAMKDDFTNMIIADSIISNIIHLASKHVLVVADSCFSGTMTRDISVNIGNKYLEKMIRKPSRTLMASGGNEPVSDSGKDGNSVFAYNFIHALQEIEEESFSAEQLFYYHVKERVAGNSEQTPEYSVIKNSGHDGGDFVFKKATNAVASLTVSTNTSAKLFINNELANPLSAISINKEEIRPGEYEIRVVPDKANEYDIVTQKIQISTAERKSLNINLPFKLGSLTVSTNTSAKLFINNELANPLSAISINKEEIKPGEYEIRVVPDKANEYDIVTQKIQISPAEQKILNINLPFILQGSLSVSANVLAKVYINNDLINPISATSQINKAEIKPGEYEIKVVPEKSNEYDVITQKIQIISGERKMLNIELPVKLSGYIIVNSIPWGKVYLDGKYLGITGKTKYKILPGEHEIVIEPGSSDKYRNITEKINLSSNETRMIGRKLQTK